MKYRSYWFAARRLGVLALFLTHSVGAPAAAYTFHHENVLGTEMELHIAATDPAQAREAESVVLTEVDRLNRILSSYDQQSELNRWQQGGTSAQRVSPALMAVLTACDRWRAETDGAFEPAVATLTALWQDGALRDEVPTASAIARSAAEVARQGWAIDAQRGVVTLSPGTRISLDGLAKGYIIDQLVEKAMACAGVSGVMVNIGGDLRVSGALSLEAGLANPFRDSEGAMPMARIPVMDGAVATSGGYQRYSEIQGKRYPHILNPKTGWPVDHVASATVTAPRAQDADALATALNVLPVAQGIALVEEIDGAACLLVEHDGAVRTSARWSGPRPSRIQMAAALPTAAPPTDSTSWDGRFALSVDFEVANPETDGRYRRPYVGVWVCDDEGFPIRTLLLWQQKDGLRWLPSLRQWYRDDQIRSFVDDRDIVKTISRSTRPPGSYSVVWDGKDDQGVPQPAGTYTLHVEAAREHGTHQMITKELTLGTTPFEVALEGNVEISHVRLNYHAVHGE